MSKPVAEIEGLGGVRVRLHDDWTWAAAPGAPSAAEAPELPEILARLRKMGRVIVGVENLADTARAGVQFVPHGSITRWFGGHEDDRHKAIDEFRRANNGIVP